MTNDGLEVDDRDLAIVAKLEEDRASCVREIQQLVDARIKGIASATDQLIAACDRRTRISQLIGAIMSCGANHL